MTQKQTDIAFSITRNGFGGEKRGEQITKALTHGGMDEGEMLDWLKDASFGSAIVRLAREYAGMYASEIWAQLLEMVREGNIQAIKLYFELWKDVRSSPAQGFAAVESNAEIAALREDLFRGEE